MSTLLLGSWWTYVMRHYDIRKNIDKIVFRALSNGAIRILLRCSGAEIYRFLMLHFKRIILYICKSYICKYFLYYCPCPTSATAALCKAYIAAAPKGLNLCVFKLENFILFFRLLRHFLTAFCTI